MDKKVIIEDLIWSSFAKEDVRPIVKIMTSGPDFEHEKDWLSSIEFEYPDIYNNQFQCEDIIGIIKLNSEYANGEEGDDFINLLILTKVPGDDPNTTQRNYMTISGVHHLLWRGSVPDNAWLNGKQIW